ncbi:MAG TPA: acyl-ACP thioesterase domain-containing protein [Candidatus Acidoferrum sp.]|nr:acyl-ACP thioesterase domain-containing protein [Candidatus Acidoferrum sp.]
MTDVEQARAVVPYRARFDECGPDAALRAAALLRWAQDIAWIHSERLGYGREWYAERDLAWVVRGLHLVVRQPIPMGMNAEVTTRVTGFRKVMARRRTDVVLPDGTLAAWGYTDWVMTDTRRAMPTRVPADFPGRFAVPPGAFDPVRVDPPPAPPDATRSSLTVRPQELDPMAHANNAVYVDWLEEAIAEAGGSGALATRPRTYRLEYLVSAAPGQDLVAEVWPAGDAQTWHHVLRSATGAGAPLLKATIVSGEEMG